MNRLRIRISSAAIGAMLLVGAPALAQDQAKDQATAPKPGTTVTPAAPAKPQPPAKPAAAATPRHIDTPKQEADSLLGKEVYGADGAQMGLVTNVLVDRAGHPIALVVDFGGFLGVGSRKVAVDWHLMQFHPGDTKKPVTLSLSKEQLKSAPEYRPDKSAQVVQAPRPAAPSKPAAAVKPAANPVAPPSGGNAAPEATPTPPSTASPPAHPPSAPEQTGPK